MGKLITIVEASRRLGLTEQTMRNWIKGGHFSVKKVGKSRYLDADTINALQDTVEDMHKAERFINVMYEERHNTAERMAAERDKDRLMRFVCGAAYRSKFFDTMVRLMHSYGLLSEREHVFLREYLDGTTLDYLASKYGLTRERGRQIVEKAIRKSGHLTEIEEQLDELTALRAENETLKRSVAVMTERLKEYESVKDLDSEEKEQLRALCEKFSLKLVDCPLSVRAMNILIAGRTERKFSFGKIENKVIVPSCNTVGDVCKLQKIDFLKMRNAGKKSLAEIDDFLTALGLEWGMDVDNIYKQYSMLLANEK